VESAGSGPASVTCRGSFELALAAEGAGELFTPEGERSWVEGWDPRYPDPDADRTAPGTVFVTDREGAEVIWVITARERSAMRYARFDERGTLATVEVEWEPASRDSTRVEVAYRSTAIREPGRAELARFAEGYDRMLASWEAEIASAVARREP
jgi:hypothetical protein